MGKKMVFFCFLVNQTTEMEAAGRKPAAGICGRCGGGATVADTKISTRFCYLPFYTKSSKVIICTFCGALLKSYR